MRVLMAMSGGVDSSVAAMLLLEKGYELVGVTFRTFDSIKESCIAREKGCCSVESIMDAKHLAERLGFEHHILDYRDIFRESVIKNFAEEYLRGRTPNPCVLCNSHIKWGELFRAADAYGCDKIATGHYARISERAGYYYLREAVDVKKDQTYFLWMLTNDNLRRTLFPLGCLTKEEVRSEASRHGFERLSKKTESQEICFVADNDYRNFLRRELGEESLVAFRAGDFIDVSGKVLGRHSGYANYTIGQRKGLGIAIGKQCFVKRIDPLRNEVVLSDRDDLFSRRVLLSGVRLRDAAWLREDSRIEVKIRYRSSKVSGSITGIGEDGSCELLLESDVWGVTPGQSAVLYKDGLVVGGGIIEG